MPDASYITKLLESQTLVASRFVPRVINTASNNNNNNLLTLPNGFSITPTSENTVDVNINGNLNISGGIDPIFLQLVPLAGNSNTVPFNKSGTLWVHTYKDAVELSQYTLKLDNNIIYDTTNKHLESIKDIQFLTLKGTTIITNCITPESGSDIIVKNANLVPSISNTQTLGSSDKWWAKSYINELHIKPNTIYIQDDDGNEMSISYDVKNSKSFITGNDVTVETVTTSKNIPGQIDPSLLPFSGLSFASKVNITEYKNNVSDSLVNQLLHSIYTLDKTVITDIFEIPTNTPECNITKITELLNGNYYVVINSNKSTEQIKLPKIKASTNFTTSIGSINITSPFTILSEELVDITDGDVLIIYYSYIPNGTEIDIIFGFQNINFRLPINTVSNSNILDNTLTSSKLKDNIITNNKIANASISLRTLSDDVLKYIGENVRDNNQISSIVCVCNELENKFNKIEKYIKILSNTYFIKDTLSDNIITLDNIDEIDF
jgi:hypothetical protein